MDIASTLVKMRPDWPNGWIYRASSLTELNCYQEARSWLAKAIDAGGNAVKLRALDDPDLDPIWRGSGA